MAKPFTFIITVLCDDEGDAFNAHDVLTAAIGDSLWEPAFVDSRVISGDELLDAEAIVAESLVIEAEANFIRFGVREIDG